MTTEAIQQLLEPLLEGTDMFVSKLYIKPTNNIKVFIDADSGFSIQRSVQINRALHAAIDEKGWFPDGDYSLEVSSPGIDEPLQMPRQYVKNIGRDLEVTPTDDTQATVIGKLTEANNDGITLAITDKKKKTVTEQQIPYSDIKSAVVQISFK